MKTTTAFRGIQARDFNKMVATKKFMARRVNKDGTPSRTALTRADYQFNAFETREAAEKRVVALEALNPGSKFVVVEVASWAS